MKFVNAYRIKYAHEIIKMPSGAIFRHAGLSRLGHLSIWCETESSNPIIEYKFFAVQDGCPIPGGDPYEPYLRRIEYRGTAVIADGDVMHIYEEVNYHQENRIRNEEEKRKSQV